VQHKTNRNALLLFLMITFHIHSFGAPENNTADSSNIAGENCTIKMIRIWQKISFNTPLLNCQFEPCCSDYSIFAIQQKGTFKGILLSADRIARCHPAAPRYYFKNQSGYLIDSVTENTFKVERNLFSFSTIAISTLIPGTHKMLHHRLYDGLSTLLIVGLAGYGGYKHEKTNSLLYVPLYTIATIFYLSDIYTNFNSIKK